MSQLARDAPREVVPPEKGKSAEEGGGPAVFDPHRMQVLQSVAMTTMVEVGLWHLWYFWSPIVVQRWIGKVPLIRAIPTPIQSMLIGSSCKIFWYAFLTFKQPSQIEQALQKYLRAGPGKRRLDVLVTEIAAILLGLICFARWWAAIEAYSVLAQKPVLPELRSPLSGELVPFKGSMMTDEVWGALITEFVLSTIHWYGVGLTSVSGKVGLRNIGWYSTFMTPMLINFGSKMPTGRPGINSSVALISAFKNPNRFWDILPLAVMDILACYLTILVPRWKKRHFANFWRRGKLAARQAAASSSSATTESSSAAKPSDVELSPLLKDREDGRMTATTSNEEVTSGTLRARKPIRESQAND